MAGPSWPAAAAALLLAAAAAVAVQPAAAAGVLNLQMQATVDLLKKQDIPEWEVRDPIRQLIAEEKGVPTAEQLRNKHRLVYRVSLNWADVKLACLGLQAGKTVRITGQKIAGGTKGEVETVLVLGATDACTKMVTKTAATAPDTFQMLLKKSKVPFQSSFTLLRCEKGATTCFTYRLAKPCPNGRCLVEPDPTLIGGVFSDTPVPLALTDTDQVKNVFQDTVSYVDDQGDQGLAKVMSLWQGYVGVAYDNKTALIRSQAGFKGNLKRIAQDSQNPALKHLIGLNQFSDYSDTDFRKIFSTRLSLKRVKGKPKTGTRPYSAATAAGNGTVSAAATVTFRASRDWRRWVTPVRFQDTCNSCWVFAVTAAVESKLLTSVRGLRANRLDLSEQQVLSCAIPDANCDSGGDADAAYNVYTTTSVVDEKFQKYSNSKGTCDPAIVTKAGIGAKINGFDVNWLIDLREVTPDTVHPRDMLKSLIDTKGPVVAYIEMDAFQNYNGGVITSAGCGCKAENVNHAVLLVGYTPTTFIAKNSWGTGWGEKGYFQIAAEDVGTGKMPGPCGLYTIASYPLSALMAKTIR